MTDTQLSRYTLLRRRIHARPELGFDEAETAAVVAAHLGALGLQVHTGIGRTGVVASIRKGLSRRSMGLRADMDALPLQELNAFAHRSCTDGRFHGCGHDGHTTMLLAAAEMLACSTGFDGTVHLIFQPAEEGLGGAQAMLDDGLFERFRCDEIYGMHNMPGLAPGAFATRAGAFFAGADTFRLTVKGRGGHAAFPQTTVDPILVCAHIVTALQSVVSRNVSPLTAAVLTIGEIKAGSAPNVIPETAQMRGTLRFLDPAHRETLRTRLRCISEHVAAGFGASAEIECWPSFPVLVNASTQTIKAARAAVAVAGETAVVRDAEPVMASEDFAAMLQQVPGSYVLIGAGQQSPMLHNPHYDFNDDIIPIGARYWTQLVQTVLPAAAKN